ncbi:MAG: hypothetical protein NWQ54_12590 [Paraglaciecola sp.]|uniref:hypothetical protein n=1 Tax=Alishewanella sp. SMS8 TaxID=2994676 RepID=UPI00274172D1|nr:hypothetical protein [Alishewanella sp. SMS8]MDP5034619.1 hypothetical protein [Alishewanella sp.]MDP5131717.1 hypothetical protein [Paraglaciecola sp.]MDP5206308.1 hypothetical protein [Alishewanella sp. SMS9]MDP5460790.1 hypothetical protein [Alishewanella sp. SMS8]
MTPFKVGNAPEQDIEQPKVWAEAFFTTIDHLAAFVDLPPQFLKRQERVKQSKVQTRLIENHALLRRVRPWFNSDQVAWAWYIVEPIVAFEQLTPSEMIKIFHGSGIETLNDWITVRELGCLN